MLACYIAKRSAGEMICQSSVYIVVGKNSIFIFLFLFHHPTEIIRKKLHIGNLNKSQSAPFMCINRDYIQDSSIHKLTRMKHPRSAKVFPPV